jgi:hypothetical protein
MKIKDATPFIIIIIAVAALSQAQTLEEVLSKMYKAQGSIEKMKEHNTVKWSSIINVGGKEATQYKYLKRPHFLRVESQVEGKTSIQAYDGKIAWQINPFKDIDKPKVMNEWETRQFALSADVDGALYQYKEKGVTVELVGRDDVDGTEAFKLKVTYKGLDVLYIYLDCETYLPIKSSYTFTQGDKKTVNDSYFFDYKPVDGVLFANRIQVKVNNMLVFQVLHEKIEVNIPMDDSLFTMPAN